VIEEYILKNRYIKINFLILKEFLGVFLKKFLLFFLLVITITQLVFAGDCGSPYFKSVACTTLNHKFTETGFVWNNYLDI